MHLEDTYWLVTDVYWKRRETPDIPGLVRQETHELLSDSWREVRTLFP